MIWLILSCSGVELQPPLSYKCCDDFIFMLSQYLVMAILTAGSALPTNCVNAQCFML